MGAAAAALEGVGSKADSALLWEGHHRQTSATEIGNGTCVIGTFGSGICGSGTCARGICGSESAGHLRTCETEIFGSGRYASGTCEKGICGSAIYGKEIFERGIFEREIFEALRPTCATGTGTGIGIGTGTEGTSEIAALPRAIYATRCAIEEGHHLCTVEGRR